MSTVQVEKKDNINHSNEVRTIHFNNQLELNKQRRQERDQKVYKIFSEIDEIMNDLNVVTTKNNGTNY